MTLKLGTTTRNTQQRQVIKECIRQLSHPTADDVWHCVVDKLSNVNKTTIYRNLNRLVEEGALQRFMTADGVMLFDSTLEEHYHLRCERCGRVFDVEPILFDQVAEIVQQKKNFLITGQKLIFSGICATCQDASAAENDKATAHTKCVNANQKSPIFFEGEKPE